MAWIGYIIMIISVYGYYQDYEWAIFAFAAGFAIVLISIRISEKKSKHEITKVSEEKEDTKKTESEADSIFEDSTVCRSKSSCKKEMPEPEKKTVHFSRGIGDSPKTKSSNSPPLESVDLYNYMSVSNIWKCPYCDGEISPENLHCPICGNEKRG